MNRVHVKCVVTFNALKDRLLTSSFISLLNTLFFTVPFGFLMFEYFKLFSLLQSKSTVSSNMLIQVHVLTGFPSPNNHYFLHS